MTPAAKYYRRVKPARDAWLSRFDNRCMLCRKFETLDVHEIEKKSNAPRTWGRTCNYLALCRSCHVDFEGNPAFWTHARQLALKLTRDPIHYDLEEWLTIEPHPATYVTQQEVDQFLKRRTA